MDREPHELTEQETAFIAGFVRWDAARYRAVILRHFGRQSLRRVAEQTGLDRCCVDRLARDFGDAYLRWLTDMKAPAAA